MNKVQLDCSGLGDISLNSLVHIHFWANKHLKAYHCSIFYCINCSLLIIFRNKDPLILLGYKYDFNYCHENGNFMSNYTNKRKVTSKINGADLGRVIEK